MWFEYHFNDNVDLIFKVWDMKKLYKFYEENVYKKSRETKDLTDGLYYVLKKIVEDDFEEKKYIKAISLEYDNLELNKKDPCPCLFFEIDYYFADKGKYSLGNQKITRDVLLRLCVYEPQEPVLSGNIMENFKMANESLNDSKIFNIIKNNDIDLLEKVKDKTSVEKLSGGEKKLIQILRGISSGANWVLLDEPFNALDIDIKEKMVKIIAEASKDRCIVATMHENYLDAYACYTYNLQ